MKKYLVLTKEILIPSLKSQSCKNFTWVLMIRKEDEVLLKRELDYPFKAVYSLAEFVKYAINNNFEIQTRHDCDDWMSPNYVNAIQNQYNNNIKKWSSFLIQSQPIQRMYHTNEKKKLRAYHNKRCSMHLSLCQKTVTNHINERQHGQMYEITPNVISLGEGFTEWVIHGDNITIKRGNLKTNN